MRVVTDTEATSDLSAGSTGKKKSHEQRMAAVVFIRQRF
jgi:hypothetical protein